MNMQFDDMQTFVYQTLGTRAEDAHKGDFGRLLLLCGSRRYRGAAALSCEAALRGGAGLTFLASTETVLSAVLARTPECICVPMAETSDGAISACDENRAAVSDRLKTTDACVCGCGMTDCADTAHLVKLLLTEAYCPILLDADGLNALRSDPALLREAVAAPVVTPHPGEMARLTKNSIAALNADPDGTALTFAQTYRCVTVFKGHRTRVASPDGKLYENKTGNPGLARGGSGDVLSGLIGAFLARGIPAWESAVCGVYLHGLAADRCAERLSQNGMLPHDLTFDLCGIFRSMGL